MSIQNSGVTAVMMGEDSVKISHRVVCSRRSLIQKMHVSRVRAYKCCSEQPKGRLRAPES